jgi:mutator protein MutT
MAESIAASAVCDNARGPGLFADLPADCPKREAVYAIRFFEQFWNRGEAMRQVVAAVIERDDRRILIGQRRRGDTSPFKWEFPGGKVRSGEKLEEALARELQEELGATLLKSREIAKVQYQYANYPEELEIHFFAAQISASELKPVTFEQVAWVLPKELAQYDFLAANRELIAHLATGKIKPAEVLESA